MVNLAAPKLTGIDWSDSKKIFEFAVETVNVAEAYQKERKTFANSLKTLKIGLAEAYQERKIERRIAEDKAYLILADQEPKYRNELVNMIDAQQQYKGLEKVLETRQALVSLAQSLIKNKVDQT